jgi:uncharacterized membrane protein YbhN (UPF0104 family)
MPVPRVALAAATGTAALVAAAIRFDLHPAGVAQTIAGSALLVGCSALAMSASRVNPLRATTSVQCVLAGTAANAITPAGIGGTAVSMRLHGRTGLTGDEAVAAITLRSLAGGMASVIVTSLAAATFGLPTPRLQTPAALAFATLLLGVVAFALACPKRRGRALHHARATTAAVAGVLKHPLRIALLLGGALGVVAAQLITLDGAVRAVGGHAALGPLLVTLLGSSAARAALPSPGGVGPVEAALVAGLATLGLPMGAAAIAVGVYRTAGQWLPVAAGILALRGLRRQALV